MRIAEHSTSLEENLHQSSWQTAVRTPSRINCSCALWSIELSSMRNEREEQQQEEEEEEEEKEEKGRRGRRRKGGGGGGGGRAKKEHRGEMTNEYAGKKLGCKGGGGGEGGAEGGGETGGCRVVVVAGGGREGRLGEGGEGLARGGERTKGVQTGEMMSRDSGEEVGCKGRGGGGGGGKGEGEGGGGGEKGGGGGGEGGGGGGGEKGGGGGGEGGGACSFPIRGIPTNLLDRWGHSAVFAERGAHGPCILVFGGFAREKGRADSRSADLIIIDLKDRTAKRVVPEGGVEGQQALIWPCSRVLHTADFVKELGQMVLIGGRKGPTSPLSDVYVLHVDTLTWVYGGHIPADVACERDGTTSAARFRHASSVAGSGVYIFGGKTSGDRALNDLLRLDVGTMTWQRVSVHGREEVPLPRHSHSLASIDTRLFLFGGKAEDGSLLNDLYMMDVGQRATSAMLTWQRVTWQHSCDVPPPPSPRMSHTMLTVEPNLLIVLGGCPVREGIRGGGLCHVFNARTSRWSHGFPNGGDGVPRGALWVRHTATLLPENGHGERHIVVLGGGAACFAFGTFFSPPFVITVGGKRKTQEEEEEEEEGEKEEERDEEHCGAVSSLAEDRLWGGGGFGNSVSAHQHGYGRSDKLGEGEASAERWRTPRADARGGREIERAPSSMDKGGEERKEERLIDQVQMTVVVGTEVVDDAHVASRAWTTKLLPTAARASDCTVGIQIGMEQPPWGKGGESLSEAGCKEDKEEDEEEEDEEDGEEEEEEEEEKEEEEEEEEEKEEKEEKEGPREWAWVLVVPRKEGKGCKDALKLRGWLDEKRRVGAEGGGERIVLPVTSEGAEYWLIDLRQREHEGVERREAEGKEKEEELVQGREREHKSAAAVAEGRGAELPLPLRFFSCCLEDREQGKRDKRGQGKDKEVIADEYGLKLVEVEKGLQRGGVRGTNPHERMKVDLAEALRRRGMDAKPAFSDGPCGIPTKWERLGDMVILPAGSFKSQGWRALGQELWDIVAKCLRAQRVAIQARIAANLTRDSNVELVLGGNGWVRHRENGIIYEFDVTECMFSSGNVTEKHRIANLDCRGETIVDLFAGIGYFVLPYLVKAGASQVYACEMNPRSIRALRASLKANGVSHRCVVLEGDNRRVAPIGVAHRVNLGLLPSSELSWETAVRCLRPKEGGILHIHGNALDKEEEQWARSVVTKITHIARSLGRQHWHVRLVHLERVKCAMAGESGFAKILLWRNSCLLKVLLHEVLQASMSPNLRALLFQGRNLSSFLRDFQAFSLTKMWDKKAMWYMFPLFVCEGLSEEVYTLMLKSQTWDELEVSLRLRFLEDEAECRLGKGSEQPAEAASTQGELSGVCGLGGVQGAPVVGPAVGCAAIAVVGGPAPRVPVATASMGAAGQETDVGGAAAGHEVVVVAAGFVVGDAADPAAVFADAPG
ncbi:hypothetical protein CBR_g48263 [Chara braunii]|uniref:tRNA(Phe) (4-demethylwyosine(37)-C(7)) aminocarboxypropyltransferase n=1 Tax=Chara braunii TaxID=69332 RepID=A0A388M2N9_CHABU|nr:hypothetical protein CBR_g48263 [Chara braunii]|eukprot:GBG88733.1 hypothetical protein CBR_g48263 [Chara braunii]